MITIYESHLCVKRKQIRFPKSKKKRTRSKWARREENYHVEPIMLRFDNDVICHPAIAARLRKEFKEVLAGDMAAIGSSPIFNP